MNATRNFGKVVRTLGLLGIMAALAGFMATTAPASAAKIDGGGNTTGKLSVFVFFPGNPSSILQATIAVSDQNGNTVAKGTASNGSSFSTYLATGTYKVYVNAQGFNEDAQVVEIANGQPTAIKSVLTSSNVPPMPIGSPKASTGLGGGQGRLTVYAIFPVPSIAVQEATILVNDLAGNTVAKGTATNGNSFTAYLAPGTYKVYVNAPNFNEYTAAVEITNAQPAVVKALLTSSNVPPMPIGRATGR